MTGARARIIGGTELACVAIRPRRGIIYNIIHKYDTYACIYVMCSRVVYTQRRSWLRARDYRLPLRFPEKNPPPPPANRLRDPGPRSLRRWRRATGGRLVIINVIIYYIPSYLCCMYVAFRTARPSLYTTDYDYMSVSRGNGGLVHAYTVI